MSHEDEPTGKPVRKSRRGFASMTPERQREIARKGGLAVPKEKRTFFKDKALAQVAGRKGGQNLKPSERSFAKDKGLAAEAGRKGGKMGKAGRHDAGGED